MSMTVENGSRIAKNSVFITIRTILTVPLILLLTPFMLLHLGKEEFGIWALAGVISSYAQLGDFGITESLVKFIAEYRARDDNMRVNQLLNTAFVMYLAFGGTLCVLLLLLLPIIIASILNIPSQLYFKAQFVFSTAVVLFFLNMLAGVFGSLITGFQRMGVSSIINFSATLITAFGTLGFLSLGYGLAGLVYTNSLVTAFIIIANFTVAKRLFPELCLNPFKLFSREMAATIFSFSWKVQIANISQLLVYQLDRVLLSHFMGLAAVSYYEVANRVAIQVRVLIATIFTPIAPAASELQVCDAHEKIVGLYQRSFKYISMTAIPGSVLVIALAPPFIKTWMGPGYGTSAITLQLLMVSVMMSLLTVPGAFILNGLNKPHIAMKSSLLAGGMNLVLCLVLVRTFGYYGVVSAILISITFSSLYFLYKAHFAINGIDRNLYATCVMFPLISAIVCAGLLTMFEAITQFSGWTALFLIGTLCCITLALMFWRSQYLDDFDRATIMQLNLFRDRGRS